MAREEDRVFFVPLNSLILERYTSPLPLTLSLIDEVESALIPSHC